MNLGLMGKELLITFLVCLLVIAFIGIAAAKSVEKANKIKSECKRTSLYVNIRGIQTPVYDCKEIISIGENNE